MSSVPWRPRGRRADRATRPTGSRFPAWGRRRPGRLEPFPPHRPTGRSLPARRPGGTWSRGVAGSNSDSAAAAWFHLAPGAARLPACPKRQSRSELTARLDQSVALPQQDFLAVDHGRQLGQRAGHAGQQPGQAGQLLLDRPRLYARRQQLRQPPRGGHLPKIEIGHRRTSQTGTISPRRCQRRITASGTGALGQHGGRVEPVQVRLVAARPNRCQSCVSVMISSVPASRAWRIEGSSHSSGDASSGSGNPSSPTTRGLSRRRAAPRRSPRDGGPIGRPRGAACWPSGRQMRAASLAEFRMKGCHPATSGRLRLGVASARCGSVPRRPGGISDAAFGAVTVGTVAGSTF